MEEKKDIRQSHQQEQTEEEKPDKQVEADQEEKDIPMLEENQLLVLEDPEEGRHENKAKINVESQAEKVGDSQTNSSSKKSKELSEQKLKAKHTIPQPFRLATEKRMSKERRGSTDFSTAIEERRSKEKRGSIDFNDSQPKLSKTVSSNHK